MLLSERKREYIPKYALGEKRNLLIYFFFSEKLKKGRRKGRIEGGREEGKRENIH